MYYVKTLDGITCGARVTRDSAEELADHIVSMYGLLVEIDEEE